MASNYDVSPDHDVSPDRDVSPGHFMLPLPINRDINIDKAVVETKLRDLQHFLQVRRGRTEELAILNLQGLLTLRLYRYEEALGYFYAVLAKDSENLNALANLQYVLEKLFRLAEAQEHKEQVQGLLNLSTGTDETASEHCLKLKARCLAEHAYAYAFDIHSDTIGGTRYEESNALYSKAIQMAGKSVDTAEKDDWKFCMAINAHKLLDSLFYENKTGALDTYIDIAVKLFYEITQRNPGDPEFQWDSWRHLGDIFRAMKIRKLPREVRGELVEFRDDPEKCMLKAMEISPDNARLLARYANFLYSLKKEDTEKPLELLERSISLDSSEFNFYAFTTRAMVNTKSYKYAIWLRDSGQESPKLSFLRNALQLAKSDLETAMSMHVTPWDLRQLGEVYYLLAKNHTKQDCEVRSLIEKALLYFTNAADCQDGHKQLQVHLMRGRCLFDIGEKRSAIGCFNQAIDCEPPTSKYTGNFNELLGVYLSILHEEQHTEKDYLVAEVAYSLKRALLKYGECKMRDTLGKFKAKYTAELQLVERYCGQYGELHDLKSFLSSVEPTPKTPNIETGGVLQLAWSNTAHLARAKHTIQGDSGPQRSAQVAAGGTDETVVQMIRGAMESQALAAQKEQPIRKAPEKARNPDCAYDFYVVYPESERDWVYYSLLSMLEPIKKLKGCTRDRDALGGSMIFTSEINLMMESASILLVINEDFRRECEYGMQQAIHLRKESIPKKVIIPIMRYKSELPDEICVFTPFDATGPVDWNKLTFSIEQQI